MADIRERTSVMMDSGEAARRPVRAPLRRHWLRHWLQHGRRRWAVAGGVLACWLFAEVVTGSVAAATVVLFAIAALGVAVVAGLRALGITPDHRWLQRLATRPWRDGQDVLNVAIRHLPDVYVVMPDGSMIAPDVVELHMNPGDLASLRDEWMELGTLSASLTAAYEDRVAKSRIRFAGSCQPVVHVVPDGSIPQGRYRLRRGLPGSGRYSPGPQDISNAPDVPPLAGPRHAHVAEAPAAIAVDPVRSDAGDRTRRDVSVGRTIMDGMATVVERIRPVVPVLRLVTGSLVAETSMTGARAGRGMVELELPDVPTVSRVHAIFTFGAGRWWVTNKGVNGMYLNGVPVSGKRPLRDGDSIRWGSRPDSPQSRVEIG